MTIHFKGKQFAQEAADLTDKLFDEKGNLRPEPLATPELVAPDRPAETVTQEAAPAVPEVKATVEAEPKTEPVAPETKTVDEDKYKAAVKAMNEAQRKAADLEKAQKDQEHRTADLEKRLKELAEERRKPVEYDPIDDLERELDDVAKISERKADRVKQVLDPRISEVERQLAEFKAEQKKSRDETNALLMRQEIDKAHPDFDEVVNSEAMQDWINNEAPPIYKSIYDGSIAASARDVVEVVNRFKSTLASPKVTADTPSDKAAAVKTAVLPSTKPTKLAPVTNAELVEFGNRGHKWPKEMRDEFNLRLEAMLK